MYPELFKIGPFTVYTYGTFVALGFLAGIWFAGRLAKKEHIDPDKITDIGFYSLVSAIFGARILYVVSEIREFINKPFWDILKIWDGGLVFYGGFLVAVVVDIWYLKRKKLPILVIADIFAPSIALGHAIGRIGCFLGGGCCYGIVSEKFGIVLSNSFYMRDGLPHIPVQLIESFLLFIIFFILIKTRKNKKFEGQIFYLYLILYGIIRFLLEFLRGDERGPILLNILSVSQFVSILLIILGFVMHSKTHKISK